MVLERPVSAGSMNKSKNTKPPPSLSKTSLNTTPLNTSQSLLPHNRSVKKPTIEYNTYTDHHTNSEKVTLYSTWTPLSDEQTNTKLYEERRVLVHKWFECWNDRQRKQMIDDIVSQCKQKQLIYARDCINKQAPIYHQDFTRLLPRVLNIYIFSYLDPRSLSRCAQVCWNWKTLGELDQLWMPKCLRFNWILNYTPSPFEVGIWKRFYIENIKAIQYIPVKSIQTPLNTERSQMTIDDLKKTTSYRATPPKYTQIKIGNTMKKNPPWRANNSNPNELYRFNYLTNEINDEKRKTHLIKTLSLDSPTNPKNNLRFKKQSK